MLKYYYKGKHKSETNKQEIKVGFVISVLAPIIFVSVLLFLEHSTATNRAIINPVREIINQYISPIKNFTKNDLLDNGGEYGVYVKNLKTGETYYYNPEGTFESASLYKLWVMEVAYEQLNSGKLKESETLSANKNDLDKELGLIPDNLSPTPTPIPDQTQTPPVIISYKVSDAINKMITVSDNYAALLLVKKLGAGNISKFLTNNSYLKSSFGSPPKTSARDIANFYETLYNKGFINANYSNQMINLLKKQEINDRIPSLLPHQIVVAHKTGELDGNKHDAGIVFTKRGDYIIVVLSNSLDANKAAGNIANLSKEVYGYEVTR